MPTSSSAMMDAEVSDFQSLVSRLEREPRLGSLARRRGTSQVILSSRQALARKYGPRGFTAIDQALRELAERATRSRSAETIVLYVDDIESLRPFGISPADPTNATAIKRIVEAISGHEEDRSPEAPSIMIIGGDAVVPFYRWPRTEEGQILTDAPYAAQGDQYFRPARPVGRLPDAANPDLGYFLHLIASAAEAHEMGHAANTFGHWFLHALTGSIRGARTIPAYGYTASLWKEAAREVFRVIGEPDRLRISPPFSRADFAQEATGPALLYFSLRGLRQAPGWYGQYDPSFAADFEPFPLAVRPEDLNPWQTPSAIAFSQAGFGGDLTGRSPRDSMTLRLLSTQAVAVISSTAMAHGSIAPPLTGADLLARYFWEGLGSALTVGQALMAAKVRYARDMMAYQGYLDLDDQKTLLSFHLFGDPGLLPAGQVMAREHSMHDRLQGDAPPAVRCQLRAVPQSLATVPLDLQRRVLDYVSERLPHLADARLTVTRPILCAGDCIGRCRIAEAMYRATQPGALHVNYVFTFTSVQRLPGAEAEMSLARVTISPRGDLLKVTTSR